MGIADINEAVEVRVKERLFERVFEQMEVAHTFKTQSREWEKCSCEYCSTKRRATYFISNNLIPEDMIRSTDPYFRFQNDYWASRRDRIRNHFRRKLNSLKSELPAHHLHGKPPKY